MAMMLELPSGERALICKDITIIGSEGRCDVRLAGLEPRHAQIRKVASRWLIESLGPWTLQVGGGDASRMSWLRPDDVIILTPGGVRITFEPEAVGTPSASVVEPNRGTEPPQLTSAIDSDRDPASEDRQDNGLSSNGVRKKPRTSPPPLPSERKQSETPPSSGSPHQTTHPVPKRPKTTPPPLPRHTEKRENACRPCCTLLGRVEILANHRLLAKVVWP